MEIKPRQFVAGRIKAAVCATTSPFPSHELCAMENSDNDFALLPGSMSVVDSPPIAKDDTPMFSTEKPAASDGKAGHGVSSEGAAEGWNFLWNAYLDYDQETLDKWKDELNNLLVFAGLFSAVVTAFTIESYKWLQEDPGDKSAALLERISVQLASFTVSANFINATQPLASLAPPPFEPDPTQVKINALWFISLALSLVAAFFAIAAQQWLRNLPLPKHLTVRDSLRLRHSRHEAFVYCQVSHIITLLPVVLQASVVVFLIGLYNFLRTLDRPTTIAFGIIAGLPFFLYAGSLFLPLLWPACPYKSPLIPAVHALFTWILVLLTVLAMIFLALPGFIFSAIVAMCFAPCCYREPGDSDISIERSFAAVGHHYFRLWDWALRFVNSSFDVLSDFWADREINRLRRHSASDHCDDDAGALSTAPKAIPKHSIKLLRPCLLEFPAEARCECVLRWVIYSLGTYTIFDYGVMDSQFHPLNLQILKDLTTDPTLVTELKQPLLDALPTADEWASQDWVLDYVNVSVVLILLMQIVKSERADPGFRGTVVGIALHACSLQKYKDLEPIEGESRLRLRYPTVTLFGCSVGTGYVFTSDQTRDLLALTGTRITECLAVESSLRRDITVQVHDTVFGLSATTLVATRQHLPTIAAEREQFWADILQLLTALSAFVTAQSADIHLMARLCQDHPKETLLITPKAVHSISESLLELVRSGQVPPSAVDVCGQLAKSLSEAASGYPVFEATMPVLAQLQDLCPASQPAPSAPMSTGVGDLEIEAESGDDDQEGAGSDKKGYLVLNQDASSSSDMLLEDVMALPMVPLAQPQPSRDIRRNSG